MFSIRKAQWVRATVFGILGLMLIQAGPASAASDAEESATIRRSSRPTYYDASSSYNRQGKKAVITAQPVGFTVGLVPSAGLNAGYYINEDSILQLEFSRGSLSFAFFDINAQTIGVNLKYFFGNSFYGKIGLAHRDLSITNVKCVGCKDPSAVSDFGYSQTMAAEISIGNQWQWEMFTLGCDWIGAMLPLGGGQTKGIDDQASNFETSDKDRMKSTWDEVSGMTSYSTLRLYLGASF